jgi:hypothetical protein
MITSITYIVQTRSHETDRWSDLGAPYGSHEEAHKLFHALLDGCDPGVYDRRLRIVRRTVEQETVERVDVTYVGLDKVSH